MWAKSTLGLVLLGVVACGQEQAFRSDLDPIEDAGPEPWVETDDETEETDNFLYGDSWDLSGTIPTDILIFGDTSTSMTDELLTMGDNILRFTDRLSANNTSWHLMAVTGPTGCGVNGWFTEDTPDFEALFSEAIITKPADESQDEMGLQNVLHAVEASVPGGCNEGFLREGALLHVIFISDENDESPGFEQADYWQGYVDGIFGGVKGNSMVVFSAVAGEVPSGCEGADPGFGYADVVRATDGEFLSICGDWPNELDTLADASIIWDAFALTRIPIPETIQVGVNQVFHTDWTYEPGPNLVRFTANPPASGDIVDIMYEVAE